MKKRLYISVLFIVSFFTVNSFGYGVRGNNSNKNNIFSLKNIVNSTKFEGVLTEKKQIVTKDRFLEIIKNPITYTQMSFDYDGDYGGLICSNPLILLGYSISQSELYEADFNKVEIKYYSLPQGLSNKLRISCTEDYNDEKFISGFLLLDQENGLMFSGRKFKKILKINRAIEIKDKKILNSIEIVCSYIEEGVLKAVLANDAFVYIINADNYEVIQLDEMGDWATISGYTDKTFKHKENIFLYLYQISKKENKIRKIEFFTKKVVFEKNLNQFPFKDDVIKIIKDSSCDMYIIGRENKKYRIYSVNEEQFSLCCFQENYRDHTSFGEIEDIHRYHDARLHFLVIFQKGKQYPVRLAYISDFKDLSYDKDIIANIEGWTHPTKDGFKKYSFIIVKMELSKHKTYPTFYVKKMGSNNIYDDLLLNEIAAKNGYWDFKIVNVTNGSYVEVYCDRKEKKIIKKVTDKD